MTKVDIAKHIHELAEISESEAQRLLDWILELLKSTLRSGEEIAVTGFGRLRVRTLIEKRDHQGIFPCLQSERT